MHKRTLPIILTLLVANLMLAAPPATVTIDKAAKKQAPVVFPHDKHVKAVASCDTCHHTQKGMTEKETKVAACDTCHLDPKAATTPSMREMSMTKNPFHMVCIDCHKKEKKGPTACTGCHKKA